MANETGTGEKTEEATPKKRKDARERGQVMKSQELVSVGALLIMFMALQALYPTVAENLMEFAASFFRGQHLTEYPPSTSNIMPVVTNVVFNFIIIMIPLLAVALVGGILLNVIQVGFLFSTKAMEPQFNRLNPLEGFKRMFSTRSLFELVKTLAKVAIVGFIAYNAIQSNLTLYPTFLNTNINGVLLQIATTMFSVAFQILIALAVLAVVDYFFQRRKYEKDLMMSKYEIKTEMKQQEGDPQIKGKIRQKQREMAMMRMMASVPEADVVITNPTEYAVALRYDESIGDAPMVTAKGKDRIAAKIKEIAADSDVDIIENKPLARGLYVYCEIGEFIPVDLYQTVAEILAQVYRAKDARR